MNVVAVKRKFQDQVLDMYDICFGEKSTRLKLLFSSHEDISEFCYGVVVDNRIQSVHNIFPAGMSIRGIRTETLYLSYIATLPASRGRGYAKALFIDALKKCREANMAFVTFDPFKHSFYRNWGAEIAFDAYRLKIDKSLLRNVFEVSHNYNVEDLSLAGTAASNQYKKVRAQFIQHSVYNELVLPGYLESWMYDPDDRILFTYGESVIDGYIKYNIQDGVLNIMEIRYATLNSLNSIRKFICSINGVLSVHFNLVPGDFPVEYFILDYWNEEGQICFEYTPFRMIRVVNVLQLLSSKLFKQRQAECFGFFIEDDLVAENNGFYCFNGTSFEKKQMEGSAISLNITDFSCLITGRKTPVTLYRSGRLLVENVNQLYKDLHTVPECVLRMEQLFTAQLTLSLDEF